MPFLARSIRALAGVALVGCAACTSSESPGSLTGPSSFTSGGATATIAGVVSDERDASSLSGAGIRSLSGPWSQVVVGVVGSNLSAPLGSDGSFELFGVPPGPVELLFSGAGVNARTQVADVDAREYIQLRIALEADTATILSAEQSAASLALCHVTGSGRFQPIYVNPSAETAHLAHGDGVPVGPVPGLELTNTFGPNCETARLDLQKRTNGRDADRAPGPSIPVGDPVVWEFVVRNIGEVDLTNVAVVDDKEGPVSCPASTLAIDESMTCVLNGVAAAGPYENLGTASADSTLGPATASDSSHYLGEAQEEPVEEEEEEEEASVKVDLCHRTGNGRFILLNVSLDAEPAHMAHGDGVPNGLVPNMPGATFGPTCSILAP